MGKIYIVSSSLFNYYRYRSNNNNNEFINHYKDIFTIKNHTIIDSSLKTKLINESPTLMSSPSSTIINTTMATIMNNGDGDDEGTIIPSIQSIRSILSYQNQQQESLSSSIALTSSMNLTFTSGSSIENDLSTNNNENIDESIFSLWTFEYISLIFFYSLIILVGLTGNLLVCRVTFSTRQMRTTTNLLIASLACSDIVMIGKLFTVLFS